MIKNYFKIAFRSLIKKKAFTIINILGLALGMAACLSIFYYVSYEFSYNTTFSESENIYKSYFVKHEAELVSVFSRPGTALKLKLDELPEIESSFRLKGIDYQNNSLIYDSDAERKVIEQFGVHFTDADIQKTLGLEVVSGSFSKMIEPMKMVLSQSVAEKFFSADEIIGKTITLSGNIGNQDYEVVGVMKDLPSNTDFNLSVLLSMSSLETVEKEGATNDWNSWDATTYLKTGISEEKLAETLHLNVIELDIFNKDENTWELKVLPLEDLHLRVLEKNDTINKSAENLLYGLASIGIFILAIAWINFINLSTARAMERAREVGVRKVLGSHLSQIRTQFLLESFLINCLSAILALTLVQFALPRIFDITDLMVVASGNKLVFWSTFIGILVIGSFLSGLYPAFVLSSFKPLVVLKGKIANQKSGTLLRKVLVVFQFASSSLMIIGTYGVYQQLNFMKNKELGVKIDDMLVMDSPPSDVTSDNQFYTIVNAFKEEVVSLNAVQSMTASSDVPGQDTGWGSSFRKVSETEEDQKRISLFTCDEDFDKTYGLELIAGRFYKQGDGTFDKGDIVLNEMALEILGFESAEEAIGKQLKEPYMFPTLTIIGVVKDFHQESLKNKIDPLGLVYSSWSNYYSLALNVDENLPPDQRVTKLKADIADIEVVWNKFFPEFPFDYSFLDDRFNAEYKSDQEFSFIISLFTILSIIIAGLGLLGLASYSVVQRTKEIGIRKVLGASITKIFQLLTVQYFWLILIASLLALPLAFYGLIQWLDSYPYRITLSWTTFVIPIVLIVIVAVVIIASQVLSATRKNPVDSLRYE